MNERSDKLAVDLYHHDYGKHSNAFKKLKRKAWNWQFLASGEVTWGMASTTYQTFNIGNTQDNRYRALLDQSWNRKIVVIAEVENFEPKYVSEIALQLLWTYENGGDAVINQMTEFGAIPLG